VLYPPFRHHPRSGWLDERRAIPAGNVSGGGNLAFLTLGGVVFPGNSLEMLEERVHLGIREVPVE
jgi:hypothetical protein